MFSNPLWLQPHYWRSSIGWIHLEQYWILQRIQGTNLSYIKSTQEISFCILEGTLYLWLTNSCWILGFRSLHKNPKPLNPFLTMLIATSDLLQSYKMKFPLKDLISYPLCFMRLKFDADVVCNGKNIGGEGSSCICKRERARFGGYKSIICARTHAYTDTN